MADKSVTDQASEAGQQAAEAAQGKSAEHSVFDKKGVVGKQFQPDGAIGSVGETVGGPLSQDGAIGKQFTAEGSVGGAVQKSLGDQEPKVN